MFSFCNFSRKGLEIDYYNEFKLDYKNHFLFSDDWNKIIKKEIHEIDWGHFE